MYITEPKDGLELMEQVEEMKIKFLNTTREQGEEGSREDFSQVWRNLYVFEDTVEETNWSKIPLYPQGHFLQKGTKFSCHQWNFTPFCSVKEVI